MFLGTKTCGYFLHLLFEDNFQPSWNCQGYFYVKGFPWGCFVREKFFIGKGRSSKKISTQGGFRNDLQDDQKLKETNLFSDESMLRSTIQVEIVLEEMCKIIRIGNVPWGHFPWKEEGGRILHGRNFLSRNFSQGGIFRRGRWISWNYLKNTQKLNLKNHFFFLLKVRNDIKT